MKLTPKIAVALLLASLVPLIVFGIAAVKVASHNLTEQVETQLQFSAARKRQQLEFLLLNYHERVRLIASRTQLRLSLTNFVATGDPAQQSRMNRILADALPTVTGFETIAVTSIDGLVRASTQAADVGRDWNGSEPVLSGKSGVEAAFFFRENEELKLRLSGPLLLDGQIIGVLIIQSTASDLQSVLELRTGLGESGEIILAMRDADGNARFVNQLRYVSDAPLTRVISNTQKTDPAVMALAKVSTVLPFAVDYRGIPVMAATEYLPRMDWGLVVKIDRSEALEPVRKLTKALAASVGGTLVLVLIISAYTSRALTRPVMELTESAARIRSGEFDHRASEERADELGELARTFNEMSSELVHLNKSLESRVVDRTAELELVNARLRRSDEQLRDFNRRLEEQVRRRTSELAASEERFQLVAQGAVGGIWDWNISTGECVYSDHWLEYLGFAPGEFPATWDAWIQRIHQDDAEGVTRKLEDHFNDRGRFDVVCRIKIKSGEYRWFRACGQAQWGADGKPIRMAGSHTDVTDQKRAETAIQQSQKLEGLGVLAGGIAHDFNNILTAIVGNISLARVEISPSAETQGLLAEVEKAALRAADLCKQMLAYSGQGKFQVQPIDLSAVITDMENLLQVSIGKSVVLKLQLADDLPAVSADPSQFRQVVMNLVINASEAIGTRSGLISVTTGLTRATADYLASTQFPDGLQPGDYVFLEVNDTGAGMNRETLGRIFDPFFTTKFTGRGLGLAALLGIVRGHHGTLKVYSEPGSGTTFKILLPCAGGEAVAIPQPSRSERFLGTGLVLIVDDEETVRATAARILERSGFTTLLAEDGRDGVTKFAGHVDELRLVLLDLTMPRLNGVEAFSEIKLLKPGIPVVLMSGYNEESALQRFAGRGLAGFIQKPFQFETLITAVRDALEAPESAGS